MVFEEQGSHDVLSSGSISTDRDIPLQNPEPEAAAKNTVSDSNTFAEGEAAVIVQKVYRSYRTRRQLADFAVMNKNYAWWNVLEGVLLQQRSEAFYAYKSQDTAANRWMRLKKKAAKVGKGLSIDENARKLAIQHWLEAIDPRHRYGHNLHYYYNVWENSSTKEPFFYWLDIGEGKEVDLTACKRSKLQKQQIKYLGPKERKEYEVVVEEGKLRYKRSGELVHTPKGDKWIFVMSAAGKLYVAQKQKGTFQHSSFLAGGAAKAAGRLLVNHGMLELMEAHSGHYRPTEENFSCLVKVLEELGTDFSKAKVQSVSDDMLEAYPSGRVSELSEEVKTEEYLVEGLSIQESKDALAACAGVKDNEGNCREGESTESWPCANVGASMFGFQVRVLDRKSSKIISSLDPEGDDIHAAVDKLARRPSLKVPEETADVAKLVLVPLVKSEGTLNWTSEAGPRIASLADVPSKAFSNGLA